MAKKTNFWYVLVLTDEGPKFVTDVDYSDKSAHWNKSEKPLELSEAWSKDLAFGLCWNGYMAYSICQSFPLDNQPYFYNKGHFEWIENKGE